MDFIRNILNFSLLIILKLNLFTLVASIPHPPPIPLNVICGLDIGSAIQALPKGCTSVAKYASNTLTSDNDITGLKGNLKYVYIADDLSYGDVRKQLRPNNIQGYISQWTMKIQGDGIDMVVFQNFYPNDADDEVDDDFQQGLKDFLDGIKQNNKDLLISLVLPNDQKLMKFAFNRVFLDSIVNFYVVDTTEYNECTYEHHESEMANIAPVNSIDLSICQAKETGYPFNKIMYIIRIVVKSTKFRAASDKDDESYQFLCSDKKAGARRKYCKESLRNFYSKGQLVKTHGLAGVLVISVDRDDTTNACTVGESPVMQVIMAGVKGLPEPKDLTSDPSFGLLPRDRKKLKKDEGSSEEDDGSSEDKDKDEDD